jgi:hypothetical protein
MHAMCFCEAGLFRAHADMTGANDGTIAQDQSGRSLPGRRLRLVLRLVWRLPLSHHRVPEFAR